MLSDRQWHGHAMDPSVSTFDGATEAVTKTLTAGGCSTR